jgi:hypothetical protein
LIQTNLILQRNLEIEKTERLKQEVATKEAEAKLGLQNQKTEQFTQALAIQQQTMAAQIHTSPQLSPAQIEELSKALTPFAGQEVIIHRTGDSVVGRLAMSIDQVYQGVSVVVHEDQGHPLLANALVNALTQCGIVVNRVALPQVPIDKVAIYLGPN